MIRFARIALCAVLLGLLPATLPAQMTKVRGRVIDAGDGSPIPYASVSFDGTSIGVSTDEDGRYYIETRDTAAVVLTAQILGYTSNSARVSYGAFSEINFSLELDADLLTAARIRPDDSYLRHILRLIDENRERHDPELADDWSVRIYSKIELDATHAEWLATRSFLKGLLRDVVKYRDTSAVTGASYIPILISETFSEKYHAMDPPLEKEVILANRISGIDPDNFMRQYAGSYLLKTNFYKSTITLFNLDVPSPAAAYGHAFYNYFLVDSLEMDGRKSYCLRFHPKRGVTSPTFDGELYIDAEDYGIRSAHVALSKGSNVNWIRHINIDTDNRKTDEGNWFPKEEKLFIDFSIAVSDSSRVISFLGNRELHYGEPGKRQPPVEALENPDVVVTSRAVDLDEDVWESARPVPLTAREQGIYTMVDEIKNKPSFRAWYTVFRSLIVGYIEGEHTEVAYGPWAQTVKYNATEGWHVGVGFRTTKFFHPSLRITGNVGYGFRDHLIKGGGSVEYTIRRDKTRKILFQGDYDYHQLGQGSATIAQPNMFNSLFSFGGGDKQTLMRNLLLEYEHEFSPSFTSFLSIESRRLYGNEMVPLYRPDSTWVKSVSANQIRYTARFSWQERINRGHFDKAHIFTRYPVIGIDLMAGIKGVTSDDCSYLRGEFSFDWKIPAGAFGFSNVHIGAGAILGEVPYPFLKLHEGNRSFFLDKTAFTCMDYYEFASDRWVSVLYEHNLNGLILGRIPLIKELDLREIITVKAAYGTLSAANKAGGAGILPIEGLSTLEVPYVEVGAGLSNILRVLRVDFTWRLTHRLEDPKRNFRVTFGFDVQF
jgi:hypothetical protein